GEAQENQQRPIPEARVRAPSPGMSSDSAAHPAISFKRVFLNLPDDQKTIWSSPFHLRAHDAYWLAPFAATTGVLIGSDAHSVERARSNVGAVDLSKNVSDIGLVTFIALPATMYAWGSLTEAPRARETGLLSGEALINSFAVAAALKFTFGRKRPTLTNGQGRAFHEYSDPSFPSEHSMLSWTAASVIAHEYPGLLSQSLAYAGAAIVSISRVSARKHFP